MTNTQIADKLQQYARDLRRRQENLFRVKAYRKAAEMILRLDRSVEQLLNDDGRNALARIPGIGKHLAETIAGYVETGRWCARH
jgi:DNA polymerase (family 10)